MLAYIFFQQPGQPQLTTVFHSFLMHSIYTGRYFTFVHPPLYLCFLQALRRIPLKSIMLTFAFRSPSPLNSIEKYSPSVHDFFLCTNNMPLTSFTFSTTLTPSLPTFPPKTTFIDNFHSFSYTVHGLSFLSFPASNSSFPFPINKLF